MLLLYSVRSRVQIPTPIGKFIFAKVGQKVQATLLSHDDGEFESYQLCGHEQGLLDELVQPAATVFCQSTAVYRTLNSIGIARVI